MKINKQSNLYTIIYVAVIVLIVGAALAITSLSLKDRQQANIDADKMRQILASVHISGEGDNIISSFEKTIIAQRVYDATGRQAGDNAFAVDVAAESKKSDSERQLPVYIADLDGAIKFIIPLYGSGLWGPIWGYIAFDADCSTIFGAYFAHQGETPGLGAEIAKPAFSDQFDGKQVWHDGRFIPSQKRHETRRRGRLCRRNLRRYNHLAGSCLDDSKLPDSISGYSQESKQ